jgi:hypothetical protein
MLSHSVNITLPRTLGVFMVLDFMDLNGDHSGATHLTGLHASGQYLNPATLLSAQAEGAMLEDASSDTPESAPQHPLQSTRAPQQLSFEGAQKRKQLEHLVGYRAGILSAAFSLSQVCTQQRNVMYFYYSIETFLSSPSCFF